MKRIWRAAPLAMLHFLYGTVGLILFGLLVWFVYCIITMDDKRGL